MVFWRIQTSSEVPVLLILSETDYPGWQVTIDGETAQGLTAYTAVRAVCVPAGEHVVEWTYRPNGVLAWWPGDVVKFVVGGNGRCLLAA